MSKETSHALSRRQVLAGLGTIGVASAGAGLGTTALFTDIEQFANNTLTAGELDLFVDYHFTYDQGLAGTGDVSGTVDGNVDGDGEPVSIVLEDIKPGDSGRNTFCFRIVDNPAYVWACGELTANLENGQPEPEVNHSDDDTLEEGELADAMQVTLSYCDAEGDVIGEVAAGSLAEVIDIISEGFPLDGTGAGASTGSQACYNGTTHTTDNPDVINPCLCLDWAVPESVGNEIQTDSVEFDLEFHAVQCRHSDGTDNPCSDLTVTVENICGDGWGKGSEGLVTDSKLQGKVRSPYAGVEQFVGQGTEYGASKNDSAENPLADDAWVPFEMAYDGTDVSLTVDGVDTEYTGGDLGMPTDTIMITLRADTAGASSAVRNVNLNTAGDGDHAIDDFSATPDGKKHCGLTGLTDLASGFTLTGEVKMDYDAGVTSELVAMYIFAETNSPA